MALIIELTRMRREDWSLSQSGSSNLTSRDTSLAAATIFDNLQANLAASSRLSTGRILRPEEPIITLASSTLVPLTKCTLNGDNAISSPKGNRESCVLGDLHDL